MVAAVGNKSICSPHRPPLRLVPGKRAPSDRRAARREALRSLGGPAHRTHCSGGKGSTGWNQPLLPVSVHGMETDGGIKTGLTHSVWKRGQRSLILAEHKRPNTDLGQMRAMYLSVYRGD